MTIFEVMENLELAGRHFTLGRFRHDAITLLVTSVGERIEIDVFPDGHLEIARFHGHEDVEGGEELFQDLMRRFKEDDQ